MCNHRNMSRSKHQTLKSVMNGQSKGQITAMFAERDHDAMEWVEKGAIKRDTYEEGVTVEKLRQMLTGT